MILMIFDEKEYPQVLLDTELYLEDKPNIELVRLDHPADIEAMQQLLTHFHSQEIGRMNYPEYTEGL